MCSASSDPSASNNGYAFSYGGGVRPASNTMSPPRCALAVAGTSRIYMTNFDIYKGLFAGQRQLRHSGDDNGGHVLRCEAERHRDGRL